MSTFTILLLCFQVLLLQNVLCQCISAGYGCGRPVPACGGARAPAAYSTGYAGTGAGWTGLASSQPAAYGGFGEGNVAVYGQLPVSGNTAITGQVPIMGAVCFSGPVAAAGAVSITGQCSCGCGSPLYY